MSSNTEKLDLFKWDTKEDGEKQFDIDCSINDNWDKIDIYAKQTEAKIAQNTTDIESIQTEQTEQNTSIQNLKNEDLQIKERLELCEKNQIYGSESDTIITIDDAAKCSATLTCSATAQLTKCATNMLDSQKLYEKMKSIVPSTIIEIVEDVQAIKFSNAGFYNSRLIEKRFKENTQYTFKFMCQGPSGQTGKSLYVIVHYTDGTKKQVGINAEDAQTFTEAKIISDVNKTIDFITFSYGSSATWYIDMNSVMLHIGNEEKAYEAYQRS